jgi:hypothetical protein
LKNFSIGSAPGNAFPRYKEGLEKYLIRQDHRFNPNRFEGSAQIFTIDPVKGF